MTLPILKYFDIAPNVTAFSTTRHGGFSTGAYGEFNINRHCGDEEGSILKNTDALCNKINTTKDNIVMPHQVHDTKVIHVAKDFFTLPDNVKSMIVDGVDALTTNVKDICIGVSTADCIPVLLYDSANHATAAIHAGWRGTVKKIVQKTLQAMQSAYGTQPENLKAVIGPGISLEAFEVGEEVYEKFLRAGFCMEDISLHKEKWHIDLKKCNRIQLSAFGIKEENITDVGICTYNNVDDYFSARRLGISSGRIFTGIMLH